MKLVARRLSLPAIASIALAGAVPAVAAAPPHAGHAAAPHRQAPAHALTQRQAAFQDAMRKLWEDHVTWTRLAIVSFAGGLPDLEATEARLLRNQADIGNAIKPYYGRRA